MTDQTKNKNRIDKQKYYKMIESPEMLDYGVYLQCDKLLSCQKPISELATADEMQFQLIHQVEELWMKLICFTLVDAHYGCSGPLILSIWSDTIFYLNQVYDIKGP